MRDTLGNYSQRITNHSSKRDMAEVCELRERKSSILYIRKPISSRWTWMDGECSERGEFRKQGFCVPACVCACVWELEWERSVQTLGKDTGPGCPGGLLWQRKGGLLCMWAAKCAVFPLVSVQTRVGWPLTSHFSPFSLGGSIVPNFAYAMHPLSTPGSFMALMKDQPVCSITPTMHHDFEEGMSTRQRLATMGSAGSAPCLSEG